MINDILTAYFDVFPEGFYISLLATCLIVTMLVGLQSIISNSND